MQDLFYTYDPVGNITEIRDDAQQTVYFDNAVVEPQGNYEYDPLYRLTKATGREHIGQQENNQPHHRPDLKPYYDFNDITRRNLAHPHDGQKMQTYTQLYKYDEVGNILKMIHQAASGGYTRRYEIAGDSNRLLSTSLPGDGEDAPYSGRYEYDDHGNMTRMPHLREMIWDFKDQLQQVDLNGGGRAYYVYNAGGQRVRKVHEHNGGLVEERIYLGGFEIYRKQGVNPLVRETLHIMDDKQRIAMVETRTEGDEPSVPPQIIRYQFGNHLGSACLELNEFGAVISYEEYHPYGTSSYQAGRSVAEVSLKRYRYTGMERDEETGLNYHTARYYAPWLGRWCSADPVGLADGVNIYSAMDGNPLRFFDNTGTTIALGFHADTSVTAREGESVLSSTVAQDQLMAIRRYLRAVGDAQARELGLEGEEAERFALSEAQSIELREGRLHVDLTSAQSGRGQRESWVLRRLWELTHADEVVEVTTVGAIHHDGDQEPLGITLPPNAVSLARDNNEPRILVVARSDNRLAPRYVSPNPQNPNVPLIVPDLTLRADPNFAGSLLDMGETFVHELVLHAWRDAYARAEREIPAQITETVAVWNAPEGHNARRHQEGGRQSGTPERNVHSQADLEADLLAFYAQGNRILEQPLSTSAVRRLGGVMAQGVERLRAGAVQREQSQRRRRVR